MDIHCILLTLLLLPTTLLGQHVLPSANHIFEDSLVGRVDILIDGDDLNYILADENQESNEEFPATFIYTFNDSVDTLEQVGFRLRGNTSRKSGKQSFKVSFNSFKSGQKYKGLEKLNLNGEHNDPTVSRAKIGWQIMADLNVPAARTNHVALYINNEYRGLYLNVEHIDEEFIKLRFDDANGNLYKCLWPADLTYLGSNPDLYKVDNWGRRTYELKTNTLADDYTDLINFLDIVNNTPLQDLTCELEPIFDIQNYLKLVAADVFMGNWDGHIFNKNNFYLYNDPCTGTFTMIPFDLDNILGIDWFGIDWADAHLNNWQNSLNGDRPLFERLMLIPTYRRQVEEHLEQLRLSWLESDYKTELYALRDKLSPYRIDDVYAEVDYNFTLNDFSNNFTHGLTDHVKQGLIEYLDNKLKSIEDKQDLLTSLSVEVVEYLVIPLIDSTRVDITTVFGKADTELAFNYNIEGGSWDQLILEPMTTNNYTVQFPNEPSNGQVMSWYILSNNGFGGISRFPECGDLNTYLGARPTPHLVINEIVASNTDGQQDEYGEYEDWIEVYNAGEVSIELNGLFLTDDNEELDKWKLPHISLSPGDYLTVYADNDTDQGDNHTNFKLNKDGEFLALVDSKDNYYAIIDSVSFPPLSEEEAYSRLPNGIGPFQTLTYQTFGRNNEESASTQMEVFSSVNCYPNPTSDRLTINSTSLGSYQLLDSNGSILSSAIMQIGLTQIDLSKYPSGIYLLATYPSSGNPSIEKIVIN